MRILRSFFQKILFILFYGHLGMLQFFLIHEKYKKNEDTTIAIFTKRNLGTDVGPSG